MTEPEQLPAPDPGNSPPEDWTEDLDPVEAQDVIDRLLGYPGEYHRDRLDD